MDPKNGLTSDEATEIAQKLGLDLADEPLDLEQSRMGSTWSSSTVDGISRRT